MDGWYYSQSGQSVGPITQAQLKQMLADRQLSAEDPVWHPSLTEWTAANRVPGLVASRDPAAGNQGAAYAPASAAYAPASAGAGQPHQMATASYHEPQGVLGYQGAGVADPVISPLAMTYLRKSRGWVMLFAVLFFLGAALCLLGSIGILIAGSFANSGGGPDDMPQGLLVSLGIAYLLIALVNVALGYYLVRFFNHSGKVLYRRQSNDVELTFQSILQFWRFSGIAVIIGILLYIVMVAVMVATSF